MISFREVEDPRTGDVEVQAFRVMPGGDLVTLGRLLRYVDLQDKQLGDRLKVTARIELTMNMESFVASYQRRQR